MSWWNFRKNPVDKELDTELGFHIQELVDDNIASGMLPEEARRQAILEFGGRQQMKEELRDVHRSALLDGVVANLKAAVRFIRKSPSFALTVILTLAIGIGANTAVFSAINAILLRPLAYPEADSLVQIGQGLKKSPGRERAVAPIRLEEWNRMNSTFTSMFGFYTENDSETSGSLPEKVTQGLVSPRFVQTFGVAPAIGRDFTSAEQHFGGPRATILSDRYWRRRFNADPSAIGRAVYFGKSGYTIVGVMPPSFPDRDVDMWLPVAPDSQYAQSRESTWYTVIGRLKAGSTLGQAQADLTSVQTNLGRAFPKTDADIVVEIQPLKDTTVGSARRSLWLLFGAVTVLLLIACINIAALLLARSAQRQHEISIRFSLGASRATIIWQLLTEAFVLAAIGATLGIAAAAGTSTVFRLLARNIPRVSEIHVDWRLAVYTLGSALFATLVCALLPALRATTEGLSCALSQAGRTQVSSRSRLQWLLVGVQVSLAVTLLAGAGLFLRSFQELGRVSPGFDPDHVLTLRVSGSWGETADMKRLTQRIDRTLDALRASPGVEAAATSAQLPGVPLSSPVELKIVEDQGDAQHKIVSENRWVSRGYFATMHVPIIAGDPCPNVSGPYYSISVNRSFANTYFPGGEAVGHHLQAPGNFTPAGEIRAVVADARDQGLDHAPVPTAYWCTSSPTPDPHYLVRVHGDAASMASTLRLKIHEVEPNRSVFAVQPLTEHLSNAFAENRMSAILLGFFAVTAVSLACIGLYGTLSYFVALRRREVGLRLALGALRSQIISRFVLQGLGVTLAGCAVGALLADGFGRFLSGMLYGVTPSDTTTMIAVLGIVLVVAALASLAPSIRAARLDPMRVLREE